MNNTRKIAIVIGVLAVVGLLAYIFYPKNQPSATKEPELFEFNVMDDSLADWEIDKFYTEYLETKAVLETDPNNFGGLIQLGSVKKRIGDYRGSEHAWLKVNDISPLNSTSFGNLADLYVNFLKEYDKAVPMYETAIENSLGEEKNVYFYRSLYTFYKDYLNDTTKAEQTLLDSITDNPDSGELHILLGIFYKEQGQLNKAIEYLQTGVDLWPTNVAAKQELEALKAQQ